MILHRNRGEIYCINPFNEYSADDDKKRAEVGLPPLDGQKRSESYATYVDLVEFLGCDDAELTYEKEGPEGSFQGLAERPVVLLWPNCGQIIWEGLLHPHAEKSARRGFRT